MPLGNTDLIHNEVVMHNILGDTNNGYSGQYDLQGFEKLANAPGVFVHMYGKTEVRNARKMGHFTIVHDKMAKDRESLLKEASDLRTYITFKPFT